MKRTDRFIPSSLVMKMVLPPMVAVPGQAKVLAHAYGPLCVIRL
ncbi:hypothetical protein [Desulfoluna sp.]|nr:hypothetical protein [Desulfoluna sp.]